MTNEKTEFPIGMVLISEAGYGYFNPRPEYPKSQYTFKNFSEKQSGGADLFIADVFSMDDTIVCELSTEDEDVRLRVSDLPNNAIVGLIKTTDERRVTKLTVIKK